MSVQEEDYLTIYFPEVLRELRTKTYEKLLDIDANYSKILQELLLPIKRAAEFILSQEKNFRHFDWAIEITDKIKIHEEGAVFHGYKTPEEIEKEKTKKAQKGKRL